ncbi:MAG: hypothetical protein JO148_13150 [Acidimicrobiia bacterium]|nr:hypothetical protein [Acidimicrobiia bacterium]
MRRAVALGLLTLGILFGSVSAASAQTTTPPTAKATSSSTSSQATTSTSTPFKPVTAGGSGNHLPTLGEGFPWITIGAVILVAGLVGARLRAASRR